MEEDAAFSFGQKRQACREQRIPRQPSRLYELVNGHRGQELGTRGNPKAPWKTVAAHP